MDSPHAPEKDDRGGASPAEPQGGEA
jgi:hypothetical protein